MPLKKIQEIFLIKYQQTCIFRCPQGSSSRDIRQQRQFSKTFPCTGSIDCFLLAVKFLNDINCDANGFLYVTDSRLNAVFKINPNGSYTLFAETKPESPNGILYDKWNNRLIVCYFSENIFMPVGADRYEIAARL